MNLLQASLLGGAGFRSAEDLLADLTLPEAGSEVPGVTYTLAGLLAHLNATMRVSLDLAYGKIDAWPEDLNVWPAAPATEEALAQLLTETRLMLAEGNALALDPSRRAQDILLDLAVHNAYHWGQVALVRQGQGHKFSSASET